MDIFLQKVGIALNYTQELLLGALILARTMPMIVLNPFLGGKLAPNEIKMGLGVMIAILLWPVAHDVTAVPTLVGPINHDHPNLPITALPFVTLMLKEVFVGLGVGFVNVHMWNALDMAGRLIDTARGSSMAEVQDPHSQQRVTPLGDLYTQLFLVIFVALDGHHVFIKSFAYSFAALPVTDYFPIGGQLDELMALMIKLTAELLVIAVGIAAPALAATLITDIVFGLLNRVSPQLNAYFMAMPVKAMAALVMILVAFDVMLARFHEFVVWTIRNSQAVLDLFATHPGW